MKTLTLTLLLVVLSITGCVTLAELELQATDCVSAIEQPTQDARNLCWHDANARADRIQDAKLKRAREEVTCTGDLVVWCRRSSILGAPRPGECVCVTRAAMREALHMW